MSTDDYDFDTLTPDDGELLAGLHRSVAGATMTTSAADVVALGRRTRTRHRAVAAGIGTGAAAVVAAIGMLAPSAGSGPGAGNEAARGRVPNAVAQDTGTVSTTRPNTGGSSAGDRVLNIQDAGFSLEEHADGTVLLSLGDAVDPAKLQAAMDQAGIPAAIIVRPMPQGWEGVIRCTPDPGVHIAAPDIEKILMDATREPSPKLKFNKSEIPAGDYVTLERFESHGRIVAGTFSVKVGRQTTCVPQHWSPESDTAN